MSDSYASDVTRVQELLGPLRGSLRDEVEAALAEDREGVLALAEEIAHARERLANPPGVFASSLRKGEWRETGSTRTSAPAHRPVSHQEAMRRLYEGKMRDMADCGWPEAKRIEFSVDYACDWVTHYIRSPLPPGGIAALENELYASLGLSRFEIQQAADGRRAP